MGSVIDFFYAISVLKNSLGVGLYMKRKESINRSIKKHELTVHNTVK